MKSQNLSNENSNTDEDARHKDQETTEVLWSDFSQEHGHYTKRNPCSSKKERKLFSSISEYLTCLTFPLGKISTFMV